jgi:hypothetical protein
MIADRTPEMKRLRPPTNPVARLRPEAAPTAANTVTIRYAITELTPRQSLDQIPPQSNTSRV